MTRDVRLAAVTLLIALAAPSAAAQSSALLGRWTIEYVRGQRVENGEATTITGTAALTVEARGDSLVATLQPAAGADGVTPPPQRWAGTATADGAVFVVKGKARLNLNGEIVEKDYTATWTLAVQGDALKGTMARVMEDAPMASEPTPVTGTRASP